MSEVELERYLVMLERKQRVEFVHDGLYYEVFVSMDYGYIVNVYSDNQRDEDNLYLEDYMIDGGICTGSAIDAIEFMLYTNY